MSLVKIKDRSEELFTKNKKITKINCLFDVKVYLLLIVYIDSRFWKSCNETFKNFSIFLSFFFSFFLSFFVETARLWKSCKETIYRKRTKKKNPFILFSFSIFLRLRYSSEFVYRLNYSSLIRYKSRGYMTNILPDIPT